MPKFLTFKSPSSSDLKENPLKALYESFLSFDKFTKGFLIVLLLILISTPFLVNNLLIFKPHAQETEPTLGEQTTPIPPSVPDEILIKFKAGVNDKAKEKVRNEHGLNKVDEIKQIGVERIKVPSDKKDQIIEALKHNPQVKYAEPNFIAKTTFSPNDPYYVNGQQWNMNKVSAPQAWDITQGNSNIIVAILDTGIDTTHPDLAGKVLNSVNFSGTTSTNDVYSHGTHVAGIVAALTNNSTGVAGLGINSTLDNVKVLNDTGSGNTTTVANGITWATDHGAKVINMSLELSSASSTVQTAVDYAWNKGLVLVAAAGNSTVSTPTYPGAFPNVIAVAATTTTDTLASYSNFGDWVSVAAPGSLIYSTISGGGIGNKSGTSQASPLVAGEAALILAANPSLTNQQVVGIITSNVDNIGTYNIGPNNTGGRINACKALKAAVPSSNVTCPTSTSSPTPAPSSSPSPTPTPIPTPTPDTTLPSVNIASPSSGSTVSGSTVSFNVDATDNVGVTKVEFYADNVLLPNGTEVSAPYTASWDTSTYSNSSHSLSAKAYDNAGNVGSSSSINVNVSNIASPTPSPIPTSTPAPVSSDTTPPVISITSPLNGSILPTKGSVKIQAGALDSSGISQILMYFDNTLIATCNGVTSCQGSKSVAQISKGTHTIRVQASDNSIKKNTSTTTISVVK